MNKKNLLVGIVLTLSLPAQNAQQPSLRWFSQSLQRLVEQISPAVVQISAQSLGRTDEEGPSRVRTERGGGSGGILDPNGYIVTNAHVVRSSTHIQVLLPEKNANKKYKSILKPAGKLL